MSRTTSTVARHALAYATGSVVGGMTRAILLPVIARRLAPEEFGVFALLLAATNFLHLIFEWGLVTALIKFHHETDDASERRRLVSTVFLVIPIVDALLALALIQFRGFASVVLFGNDQYASLVVIAIAIAYFGAQFQIFLSQVRAQNRSRDFVIYMAVKGVVSLGLTLWLVLGLDGGVRGFLLGTLAGPAAVSIFAIAVLLVRTGVDVKGARARLRRLLGFGLPLVPAALGLWALTHVDTYLLRVLGDLHAVGVYGFASELCLPIALLMTSIHLAWPSFAFARARQADGAEQIAKVFRHLFVLLVGGALAVSVLRREILAVVGTEAFHESARVLPLLTLATVIYGASQAFSTGLQVAGDTRRLPFFVLLASITNALLNVLLIPMFREMGAAAATVVTNVLLCALVLRESNRQFPIPFELGRIARVLVGAAVVLLAADALGERPLAVGIPVRVALLAVFAPMLVILGALSARELRALPSALAEVARGRAA